LARRERGDVLGRGAVVKEFIICLVVNVHGWEETVDITVMAENRSEACDKLGALLTELVAKRDAAPEGGK
jgi:hypothetical protein